MEIKKELKMKSTQKTFTIKVHTTNMNLAKEDIKELIDKAIEQSPHKEELRVTIEKETEVLFNFLNDPVVFGLFIRTTKEEFLKEYPYFSDEYDFCLNEFYKNPQEALLNFLESTSTLELTEPYSRTPADFSFSVGIFIEKHFTEDERRDFLLEVVKHGLTVEM